MNVQAFLDKLDVVARSPYALIGYVVLVVICLLHFRSRHRLRGMERRLDALRDVPESERADILRREYNLVPRHGISANQYIQIQRDQQRFWAIITVILALLILCTVVVVSYLPSKGQSGTTDGTLVAPETDDARNLLKIGDSSSVIQSIRGDKRDRDEPSFGAFDSEIYVWKESSRYHVGGAIRDEQGNLVLQIMDNKWRIFPSFTSDKNYNNTALEVKDNRGRIVFQIAFLSSCVALQARLISGYGQEIEIYSSDPSEPAHIGFPRTQENPPPMYLIRPIFEYPSNEKLGKMTVMGQGLNCEGRIFEKNLPSVFNPLSTSAMQQDESKAPASAKTRQSPAINQNGRNNIAQVGNNNKATIIERKHLVITPEIAARVTERLRPFAGRKITFQLNKETQESSTFGESLARAFQNAGIEVEVTHIMIFGAVPSGVSIIANSQRLDHDFIQAVINILTNEGLAKNPMEGEVDDNATVPLLRIAPPE